MFLTSPHIRSPHLILDVGCWIIGYGSNIEALVSKTECNAGINLE